MLPWRTIDRAPAPGGDELVLSERNGEYSIRVGGVELMSSRAHGSEDALAQVGCEPLEGNPAAHVLIGGLGMGYTLRAALNAVAPTARVTVAELVPAVVAWNREHLGALTGHPLSDPRVEVVVGDVGQVLRTSRGRFDAVLLDVDNGPAALTSRGNAGLYDAAGLAAAAAALRPGGLLAVWSAGPDAPFGVRMRKAGFRLRIETVPARGTGGGTQHTLFVGLRATDRKGDRRV